MIYDLSTESEVITGKSQTEALNYYIKAEVRDWDDRTEEVNKLFIIWPFHYGPEPALN